LFIIKKGMQNIPPFSSFLRIWVVLGLFFLISKQVLAKLYADERRHAIGERTVKKPLIIFSNLAVLIRKIFAGNL